MAAVWVISVSSVQLVLFGGVPKSVGTVTASP